jgi:hypothetical protein
MEFRQCLDLHLLLPTPCHSRVVKYRIIVMTSTTEHAGTSASTICEKFV